MISPPSLIAGELVWRMLSDDPWAAWHGSRLRDHGLARRERRAAGGTEPDRPSSIEAMRQDGNVLITVANTGSRLTREQVSHVFERFWRGDTAREAPGTRCGLGLSLCKTIIEQLGGTITADVSSEGTFSIVLEL